MSNKSTKQSSVARRVSWFGSAGLAAVLLGICGAMSVLMTNRSREQLVTWVGDKTQAMADSVDAFDLTSRVLVDKFFISFKSEFDPEFTHTRWRRARELRHAR